jgi:ribonuclease Z
MNQRIRSTLLAAGVALLLTTSAHSQLAPTKVDGSFSVVLLGTGTPNPSPMRFGPSTLVQAGGQNLLFDVGRGATIRLWQAGVSLGKVDQVFLTHFHSDHTNGLPDLWLTGWVSTPYGSRKSPLHITGPTGVQALTAGLEQAYADDVRVRIADEHLPADGIRFAVHEFPEAGGVVYDEGGVKVTAFPNDHGDQIHPSVGYRIDYKGHAVVISGDTRPNDNMVKFGQGVDLLIHEVAAARPGLLDENPMMKPIMAHHTTPEQAGEIFGKAKPRLAAYTHFVLLSNKKHPPMTPKDILEATRTTYGGPLALGEDLTRFDIGADAVTVTTAAPSR